MSGGWRGDLEILSQEGGEKEGGGGDGEMERWTHSGRQVRAMSRQAADL